MPMYAIVTDNYTCGTTVIACDTDDRCVNSAPNSSMRGPLTFEDIHAAVAEAIDACLRRNLGLGD